MSRVKTIILILMEVLIVSACVAPTIHIIGGTSFTVDLSRKKLLNELGREAPTFIVKRSSITNAKCSDDHRGVEPYIFWSGQCYFESGIPDRVDIQYAKWKPSYQIPDDYKPHMMAYGSALPASAWQTYTFYPKKVMAEVKRQQKPSHTPFVPKVIAKTDILVYLDIEADGRVTIRDEAEYGYVNNIDSYR